MKTVIEMACEAGFASAEFWPEDFKGLHGCVVRFAELVRADEREQCAKVAEDMNRAVLAMLNITSQPKALAAAIRSRSKA